MNDLSDYLIQKIEEQIEPMIGYTNHAKKKVKPVLRSVELQKRGLVEAVALDEARIAIIKARIRGGKIQRRKKVSNVAGYTLRGGRLTRMSVSERRNRKMGQRLGKIKRRARMTQTLMKRTRSLRRRKALGL